MLLKRLIVILLLLWPLAARAEVGGSHGIGNFSGPINMTGTSGNGSDAINKVSVNGVLNALAFAGSDIGAQTNAAIAALPHGGHIQIPCGLYTFATGIVADSTINIRIIGEGSLSGGAQPCVSLRYSGTGTPVSAKSAAGFVWSDIQLIPTNAAFANIGIDLSHATATDASFNTIQNSAFFTLNGGSFSPVINLDKAISTDIHNSVFNNYSAGIGGAAVGSTDYSNRVNIYNNTFSSFAGTSSGPAIRNPKQAWNITSNAFEMGTAGGTPQIIANTGTITTSGLVFQGNWAGDATAGSTETYIALCGYGFDLNGNYISGAADHLTTAISLCNGGQGLSVHGNLITLMATALSLGAGNQVDIGQNAWSSITTFMSGTPSNGIVEDNAGHITTYGGLTLATNTALQMGIPNVALGGGATPTFGTIGGTGPATAAQNSWIKLYDSTGAAVWVPAWK